MKLAASLKAARAQRSVHYDWHSAGSGSTLEAHADIGLSSGVERITFVWKGQTGRLEIRLIGRVAYMRGNAFGLWQYWGFRKKGSEDNAGRWIRVISACYDYDYMASRTSLAPEIERLDLLPPFAVRSARVAGRDVFAIHGRTTSGGTPAVLSVLAGHKPLPVEERINGGDWHATMRFSRWNERVEVHAPASWTLLQKTELRDFS